MWRRKDKAVPNRGWKNRMAGTTCPSCDGTGGGKNTVLDSGGRRALFAPGATALVERSVRRPIDDCQNSHGVGC